MTKAQCVMTMFSTSWNGYTLKKAGISLKAWKVAASDSGVHCRARFVIGFPLAVPWT